MAEKVHPADSSPLPTKPETNNQEPKFEADTIPPRPKSGTYVIQVPKDQIYGVPPENATLFEYYSRGRRHRCSPCCRLLIWTLCAALAALLLIAVAAAVLYFVLQPKLPSYSLDAMAIKGFDVSRLFPTPAFSPEFDIIVRADNPNEKIGLSYSSGSDISVSYSDTMLCHGTWPVFFQGPRNVTVFQTVLKGSGVRMGSVLWSAVVDHVRRGEVPLVVDVKVPVRVRFGAARSWTVTARVRCDVVVDRLTESSKIVTKSCSTRIRIW